MRENRKCNNEACDVFICKNYNSITQLLIGKVTFSRVLRWLILPYGNVMNTDVFLGHAEQELGKLDAQEERKVVYFPAHV